MKLRLFILCLLVAVASSLSGQHLTVKNYQKKALPRNLILIEEGVYCDYKPISNQDWREYLYWLERIYGKESEQYRAALPDDAVLEQQLPDSIASYYLRYRESNHLPVLGVSPEQTRGYCQWSTDRVAEYILVGMRLREWGPTTPFFLADYDNTKHLQFLYFYLPKEGMETRYGFFCFAEWR